MCLLLSWDSTVKKQAGALPWWDFAHRLGWEIDLNKMFSKAHGDMLRNETKVQVNWAKRIIEIFHQGMGVFPNWQGNLVPTHFLPSFICLSLAFRARCSLERMEFVLFPSFPNFQSLLPGGAPVCAHCVCHIWDIQVCRMKPIQ
jgi:hypothetical protein